MPLQTSSIETVTRKSGIGDLPNLTRISIKGNRGTVFEYDEKFITQEAVKDAIILSNYLKFKANNK